MSKVRVFVQVQGKPGIRELEVGLPATPHEMRHALTLAAIEMDPDTLVFVDESDEPLQDDHSGPVDRLKAGSRIHITRCRKIKVAVHYLDRTIEHGFAPGVRVRAVKLWAVREFKINPTDAGEHVLQLCNSTNQPPTDASLAELTDGSTCAVCFDLVPEKRVEG